MWTYLLFVCIALPLCARLLPTLCIYLWLKLKGRSREVEDLKNEIRDLKEQQSEINMVDQFAKHAKLGRKINTKTSTLQSIEQSRGWIRMKAYWYTKIAIYIISVVLLFCYKYEPVILFNIHQYLDNPIIYVVGYILSFPTGMPGAIGMPVALFVCNRSVNQILNLIIPDKSKQALRHEPVE